jgi:hypothetical protein
VSKHSAIEIQISARVRAPRNGRALTDTVIYEAIKRRVDTGRSIPGIELRIVRWRHSQRARWRAAHRDEWERFGRFLPSASFIVGPIKQIRSR